MDVTFLSDNVTSYGDEDGVLKVVISVGLFYEEYVDAIREGDGEHVKRCLKFLLPIFKSANRKNYSLEILYTLYQYYFLLSSREAEELIWSRFVNVHGIPGKNIPMDLHMEHLNKVLKSLRQIRKAFIVQEGLSKF